MSEIDYSARDKPVRPNIYASVRRRDGQPNTAGLRGSAANQLAPDITRRFAANHDCAA